MRVILRENVENLGRIGDVVKVSDGYARNFLLPRGLVMTADENNVAAIEHAKKMLEKRRLAQRITTEELAGRLSSFTCTIKRKVGENDKLFGSVSTHDVAEAIKQGGYNVERRMVLLDQPIKSLGVYSVRIKLEPEVTTTVKVWVVRDEG